MRIRQPRTATRLLLAGLLAIGLAGCQSSGLSTVSAFGDSEKAVDDVPDVSYYKTDEILAKAKMQFKERNYGKSYALYKRSVELFPKDPAAWLGYAASSDLIGRFDNSAKAYAVLRKMIGNRPEYYNNVGYSFLLRGKLRPARKYFLKAYDLDPHNPVTLNNLKLLKNSVAFAKR